MASQGTGENACCPPASFLLSHVLRGTTLHYVLQVTDKTGEGPDEGPWASGRTAAHRAALPHSSGCQQAYPRRGSTGPLDHCLNTTYISVNFKNSCKSSLKSLLRARASPQLLSPVPAVFSITCHSGRSAQGTWSDTPAPLIIPQHGTEAGRCDSQRKMLPFSQGYRQFYSLSLHICS